MVCIVKLTHAVRAYLSKYKLLNAKSSLNLLEHDPPLLCVWSLAGEECLYF